MKPVLQTRRGGWTLIDLLAVIVVVLVGLWMLGLLFPLSASKPKAMRINCLNNLGQIGKAFHLWSADYGDRFPMGVSVTNGGTLELVPSGVVSLHFQVMSNELNTPKVLICPADSTHSPAADFQSNLTELNISYFVGVDADSSRPQMLLGGDRGLALGNAPVPPGLLTLRTNAPLGWVRGIHGGSGADRRARRGNVVLVDGSVQMMEVKQLQTQLQRSGVTNRLATP